MFSNEDIRDVIRAEKNHEVIANLIHLPIGKVMATAELSSVVFLESLLKTTKRIAGSKSDVSVRAESNGKAYYRFSQDGRKLYDACNQYRDHFYMWDGNAIIPRHRNHTFNPYLKSSLENIAKVEDSIIGMTPTQLHQTIVTLAQSIREECNTPAFKAKVRNYKRNAKAKFKRALRYLLSLFRKCSRLLILRVDLYVRQQDVAWSYTAEADAAFDKFVEALSAGKIVPDVVGWMAAREDGPERGQHYHCLVAINSHLHHAGANLTKMLGEHWKNVCVPPDKAGSYFNCFSLERKYKHLGIGMIHCTDAKKLLGLFYATRYLFKDEVLTVATGTRTRNFRRGTQAAEKESASCSTRRGAPRLHGDDLSVVKKVFFGEWTKTADEHFEPA